MVNKIKVKLILELHKAGMSRNTIADNRHMSRSSVTDVIRLSKEISIAFDDVKDKGEKQVYCLFYPGKHAEETVYKNPDYKYVHSELKKVGVTLKLLWEEYRDKCNKECSIPMGYTKYCNEYVEYTITNTLTNHLIHKPNYQYILPYEAEAVSGRYYAIIYLCCLCKSVSKLYFALGIAYR